MTLRVAISALTLVPGISGGTESYLRHLCCALGEVGENDYTVFAPTIAPDAGGPLPARVVSEYAASQTVRGRIRAMVASSFFPSRLAAILEQAEPDVIHFPLTIHVPRLRARAPIVTTLHDVQHEVFPQLFSKAELIYRRIAYRDAVRRSDCVITISDHARQAIIDTFGVDPSRVRRIYSGVDSQRFHPDGRKREPFVLYPANRWPHKNHERLFRAMDIVRAARPDVSLVLTGVGHDQQPLPEGIATLGHVPTARLPELYRSASALVFPSLYEGFGLPLLEAMASGCPVACSNAAALPEVAGDAAALFDPLLPDSIGAAVLRVLSSPEEYSARGLQRAARFTWTETARQHDAVYREFSGRS